MCFVPSSQNNLKFTELRGKTPRDSSSKAAVAPAIFCIITIEHVLHRWIQGPPIAISFKYSYIASLVSCDHALISNIDLNVTM